MQLYVLQGENQLGPYSPNEIRARVHTGEFSPDDFAWAEGMLEWLPISQVLPSQSSSQPAAPLTLTTPLQGQSAMVKTASPTPGVPLVLTTAKKAALAGVALLFLGAFSPVVSVPIVGGVTFLKIGWPAYLVLALAVVSAITVLRWPMKHLWASGGGVSLVLVGCLAKFLYNMHAAKAQMAAENPAQDPYANFGRDLGMAALEAVQLQWGCFILGLGAALVLSGAYLAARE